MHWRVKAQSNLSKVNGRESYNNATTNLEGLLLGKFRYYRVSWKLLCANKETYLSSRTYRLNKKLRSNRKQHDHVFVIPIRQIQSQPLKLILWLRNLSAKPLELKVKRVQNCQCQPLQTRVGFNQFRQLFHCPHRRLISVSQEILNIQPDEVLPMSVTAQFFLYGEHFLTFEIK